MSEYIKSDVGEYLSSRTTNFEKSPPDAIWENIEKNIPVYQGSTGTVSTMVKLVIGTISLSAIIFAVLWIKYQDFSGDENNKGLPVNRKATTNIQILNSSSISITNSTPVNENILLTDSQKNTEVSKESNIEKHNTITTKENQNTEPGKNMTYSINASGLKNVTEISFVNENNEAVLSVKNPVPNSFGFFILDISKLAGGTYNIMITTNQGTRLHKKETFK